MTTAVPNALTVFGTHEAAVVNAEAQKSAVRKSAAGGALPRVCSFIAAAPLFMDLTGSAAHFSSSPGIQGRSACPQVVSRADDPPPLASQIWSGTRTPPAPTTGLLGRFYTTVVQPDDRPTVVSRPITPAGHTPLISNYWDQPPDRLDDRSSSTWKSVQAAVMSSGILGSFVAQGPQAFDLLALQPVIETPTFSPQGYLVTVLDAAPEYPWNLASQLFPAASAAPLASQPLRLVSSAPQPPWDLGSTFFASSAQNLTSQPLRFQIAGPQVLPDLQPLYFDIALNRQGPTVRSYTVGPSDPAPIGIAQQFSIGPRGTLPVTGPVPPYSATIAVPSDPTPSGPQRFSIVAGGALPILGTYQVSMPQPLPDVPSAWSKAVIGPSLALRYQASGPQPLESLTSLFIPLSVAAPPNAIVRSYGSGPELRDWSQPSSIRPSVSALVLTSGTLGQYSFQGPQPFDLLSIQPQIRPALFTGPPTGFRIAFQSGGPPAMDLVVSSSFRRPSLVQVVNPAVPSVRFMLSGYPQQIVLTDVAQRIVLSDYPIRTLLS